MYGYQDLGLLTQQRNEVPLRDAQKLAKANHRSDFGMGRANSTLGGALNLLGW